MAISLQRNERKNYFVTIGGDDKQTGGVRVGFRSPSAIYESIKKSLGVKDVSEKGSGFLIYGKAGELLPRLSLKLDGGGLNTGLGNDAQSDGAKNIRVFVDPFSIEKAFKELVGKTTRGRRIISVKIPKRRVYV